MVALWAAVAATTTSCEGCQETPTEPATEAPEPASETASGPSTPDDEVPELAAAPHPLEAALPDTPGLPRLPGVDALVLGQTPLEAVPERLRGPEPAALGGETGIAGWVSAQAARHPTRTDRVNLVRLDLPPDRVVRPWLTARWGAPVVASDDSGLVFPGGRIEAAYWFAPDAGVQIKHVARGGRQRLVFRAYTPLARVLGDGVHFGLEPPGGLLGKPASEAVAHYGADDLVRDEAGAIVVQRVLPGIETATEPVRVRWPATDEETTPIARWWLEIGHGAAPGPYGADAVLAAIERTWGAPAPSADGEHGHVGSIAREDGTRIEVYRVPAAGIIRLDIARQPAPSEPLNR